MMYRTEEQQRRDREEYLESIGLSNGVKPRPSSASRELELAIVATCALLAGAVIGGLLVWWSK